MNGSCAKAVKLASDLAAAPSLPHVELTVCPPFVHLIAVAGTLTGTAITFGGQDCSDQAEGAYTGQTAAAMLKDVGATYVILGHSERRHGLGENDALIAAKAVQAHQNGLITIICVGETEQEREQGREQDIVRSQLTGAMPSCATPENTVIAYEPVWAIGTGKTATPEDVRNMHDFIRGIVGDGYRILYGGSVKPNNAAELLALENVNGALVGGASLKAEDFLGIASAA